MFGHKKKESMAILPWGLDIQIVGLSASDVGLKEIGPSASVEEAILTIAEAIKITRWLKGRWCVVEDGMILRPKRGAFPEMEGVDFEKVVLSLVDPASNTVTLAVFNQIRRGRKPPVDSFRVIVLDPLDPASPHGIMMDKGGFYLWDVRYD